MSKVDELLPPSRNFTLTLAERVRAQEGLPAHLYRKGRIEQLIERYLHELRSYRAEGADHAAVQQKARAIDLTRLNDLIDKHNRYYPIEANLPIDPRSGGSLDNNGVFKPLELVTPEWLLERL